MRQGCHMKGSYERRHLNQNTTLLWLVERHGAERRGERLLAPRRETGEWVVITRCWCRPLAEGSGGSQWRSRVLRGQQGLLVGEQGLLLLLGLLRLLWRSGLGEGGRLATSG